MATYGAVVQRIIDELPRGDTSITAIVQQQLLSAIDFYTTDRFWFNEKQTTLTTSSSLAYYSYPSDLLETDSVVIFNGGNKYTLDPMTYQEMDAIDSGTSFGRPCWYSTYGKQFRLYPVPNATYTFIVSHQYTIATLSASTETNAWTTEAESLIRARTLKLCSARFKDRDSAQMYQMLEDQEYARLKAQTDKLLGTGVILGSGL